MSIFDGLVGSDAQDFFSRLAESRRNNQPSQTPPPDIHDIITNIDSTPVTAPIGTGGDISEMVNRMARDMIDSIGVPQEMLGHPAPTINELTTNFTITTAGSDRNWSFAFSNSGIASTTQEKQVELTSEKIDELNKLVTAADPPADCLDKLFPTVYALYKGYEEGVEQVTKESGHNKINSMAQALQWLYQLFSTNGSSAVERAEYIRTNFYRHANVRELVDAIAKLGNGASPFEDLKPVVSMDVVRQFIGEVIGLLKAKKVDLVRSDSQLSHKWNDGNAISFRTERVSLKDGTVGPIDLGRFDIIINAVDFGICCANSEINVDQAYCVNAVNPVYPNDGDDGFSHPHVEGTHLCFGDGLAIAGNLVRAGLAAEAFQYIERILMTYGSSPYIDLTAWTDANFCGICGDSMSEEMTFIDPHNNRMMCENCSTCCQLSDEYIDSRYIKHCGDCDKDFDSRRFLGVENRQYGVLCCECNEKRLLREEEESNKEEKFQTGLVEVRSEAVAFPVIAPSSTCCPSCGASLGARMSIVGMPDIVNAIAAYDPVMMAQTCESCDSSHVGLSAANCTSITREAYTWTVLRIFVPQTYLRDISINDENSFVSEVDKLLWRSMDWYKVLSQFRDRISEHGVFSEGLDLLVVINKLNEMFSYNVVAESTLARVQ